VICQTCGISFRRFSADGEILDRKHCYRHHDADTQAPDPLAVMRLRRAWAPAERVSAGAAMPRVDLRDDQPAERLRKRDENPEPWRSDVPLEAVASEDRLLAAHLPELVTEAA
jgi:hypothetical protein